MDIIQQCCSSVSPMTSREEQAITLKDSLERRFAACGLELHPTKTKIVYCKDDDRRGTYPNKKFDYLGYTFRARRSKNRWGKLFVNFSPGVSDAATKAIRRKFATGNFVVASTNGSTIWRECSTPSSGAGLRTTVVTTSRRFIRRCAI
jgi:hypothetical protein